MVDKPTGISSFAVVHTVRKTTGEKRVGHAGTLDPFASGLLIIAIGRLYTRQIDRFVSLPKHYSGRMLLGVQTDTDDTEGAVMTKHEPLAMPWQTETQLQEQIQPVFDSFKGDQMQVPPQFSAKKVNGKRLYQYARKGEVVAVEPKPVTIYDLAITKILYADYPQIEFDMHCSKGTYVRSFARDVGLKLGVGAHLDQLTRTGIGPYQLRDAVSHADLNLDVICEKVFRG